MAETLKTKGGLGSTFGFQADRVGDQGAFDADPSAATGLVLGRSVKDIDAIMGGLASIGQQIVVGERVDPLKVAADTKAAPIAVATPGGGLAAKDGVDYSIKYRYDAEKNAPLVGMNLS